MPNPNSHLFDLWEDNKTKLKEAIRDAHGNPDIVDKRELTLHEFLVICASNNIMLEANYCPQPAPAPSYGLEDIARHGN